MWAGIGITLSQWAGINHHKSTEICADTVIYSQVCIADDEVSRSKAALVHKWLQKQAIKVVSIYQKLAPSKENIKSKPTHLNLAQL